jgi:cell division protein ZipA
MEADILRLILLLAGIALIMGIYFWDRHKKMDRRLHAIQRDQEEEQSLEQAADEETGEAERFESAWEDRLQQESPEEPESIERVEPVWEGSAQPSTEDLGGNTQELEQLNKLVIGEHQEQEAEEPTGEQISFAFSEEDLYEEVTELRDGSSPEKIIQLNIIARNGAAFKGRDIAQVAAEMELKHGDMNIFHRMEGGKSLFSIASMVEPGFFPKQKLDSFSTPGLILFARLPGPKDGLAIFSDMLFTAERMAALLHGDLQDSSHSDLSRQTIEHMRGEILEHRRQLQLARKRR